MADSRAGFGLVGTGMIAALHAKALAQVQGARLIGIASRQLSSARTFAAAHGIPFACDSVDTLARHPDIQVVCIATPSGAHLEPALDAIACGKHLLVEKPLEISTERVDTMLAAAEHHHVHVGAIFPGRFSRAVTQARTATDSGRLGRLVLASLSVKWHRAPAYYSGWKGRLDLDGGAVLINQAIHGLDLLQALAGMPTEVLAQTTRRVHLGIEGEDTAVAQLRFPHGALGTIEATTGAWPGWARRIELCGDAGSICLEDDRITRWDFRAARPEDETIRLAPADSHGSGSASPGGISLDGHVRQFTDFVAALQEGRAPVIDGREGRKAVSFVNALYRSAASGQWTRPA